MPTISKIRLCNVLYEGGDKRYNDDTFTADGNNCVFILENGGGKTVQVQMLLQSVLPGKTHSGRKIDETLLLESGAAHIAVEWILNESPRRYLLTAVTLYIKSQKVESHMYTYEYSGEDDGDIEDVPFSIKSENGSRPASHGEINEYYSKQKNLKLHAHLFSETSKYQKHLEENYQISANEWRSISKINSDEGGIEKFFDNCKTSTQLINNLILPTVEGALDKDARKTFSTSFESHREHLSQHAHLIRVIDQNKLIKKYVDDYVEVYNSYYNILQSYSEEKSRARGAYDYILNEKENILSDLNEVEISMAENLATRRELEKKISSYELKLKELEMNNVIDNYKIIEGKYFEKESEVDKQVISKLELELGKEQENRDIKSTRLESVRSELSEYDMDKDIGDQIKILDELKSKLAYLFVKEKKSIDIKLSIIDEKCLEIDKVLEKIEGEKEDVSSDVKTNNNALNHLEGEKSVYQDQLNKKRNELMGISSYESFQTYFKQVKNNLEDKTKLQRSLSSKIDKSKEQKLDIKSELDVLSENEKNLNLQILNAKKDIEKIDEHQSKISSMYLDLFGKKVFDNKVYQNENSILGEVESRLEFEKREYDRVSQLRAESWYELSMHENQNYFSADVSLRRIVSKIENQYNFIMPGVDYLNEHCSSDISFYSEIYKLWPITIVTREGERDKLIDRIKKSSEILKHPVLVLTTEEINKFKNEDQVYKSYMEVLHVYPDRWNTFINVDKFSEYTSSLESSFADYDADAKRMQNRISDLKMFKNNMHAFFNEYPYEVYQSYKADLLTFEDELSKLMRVKDINESKENSLSQFIVQSETNINQLIEEIYYCESVCKLCKEAIMQESEVQNLSKRIKVYNDKSLSLKAKLDEVSQSLEINKKEKENIKQSSEIEYRNKLDTESEIKKFKLNDVEGVFTDKTKASMIESLVNLDLAISSSERDRGRIERDIKDIKRDLINIELKIDEILDDLPSEYLDKNIAFPKAGETYLREISITLKKEKIVLKVISQELNKIKESKFKITATYDEKKSVHMDEFYEILAFDLELADVKEELRLAKEENEHNNRLLESKKSELGDLDKTIDKSINLFEVEDAKHKITSNDILSIPVSEAFICDYPHGRLSVLKKIFGELELAKDSLDKSFESKESFKSTFVSFAENKIMDVKLRNQTLKAIELRDDYEALNTYKDVLEEKIYKVIQIAEEDLKEHDTEINKLIERLYMYLVKVIDEIKVIERNTRIKLKDDQKDIFIFKIPKWNEIDAKLTVRDYLMWMNEKLVELAMEVDEDQKEKVSKDMIKKWLSTENLLSRLFDGKSIEVKCRKVSNDLLISNSPKAWSESNKWSGGEKWSKNMTLFLGIQNYIVQKKHFLSSKNRLSRVVLLDNPFGAASSEHVLEPVFIIAEQLGYQLIAFTAHVEGKFISDYFPIVYSCRLRATNHRNIKVMTSEKSINYAYLKEHNRLSVLRLKESEKEQLGFFN